MCKEIFFSPNIIQLIPKIKQDVHIENVAALEDFAQP